ncbi:rust resistance kinase Lr10-like [Papaver somniferum]|uniref:rust resistance kinase Lr10-like n=1 Tax=Papaver somniferum TaxID=3469 RepID=UPI000E6F751E|nr:rust resistance kinase Lr10-like [Papaver somniferum]
MNASIEDFLDMYRDKMPIRYSYNDVKKMTSNFKEKLGQGGFGSVYKGSLRNNRGVAIKILSSTKGDGQDFINEVATMGKIHHINVVQLIGFVAERLNHAPRNTYFPEKKENLLTFSVGKKLMELHWGQLVGLNIYTENVVCKYCISTLNLIIFYSIKAINLKFQTSVTHGARGTIGYMAPELFYRTIGSVSYKSDVYSFGMLLMEMAGRRKNLNISADKESQMEDATQEENEIAKKIIIVALWCIQLKPVDRPSMTKVVEMLEGELGVLQIPDKPFSIADWDGDEDIMLNSLV